MKRERERKRERSKMNSLLMHSKILEKQEQGKSIISRWKEKIWTEINEIENKIYTNNQQNKMFVLLKDK
jgi:hypothetical protein